MKTTNKGCANKASLLLWPGNKGSETDLTALTFDISQWTDVEIVSANNIVSIYIDNKVVFFCARLRWYQIHFRLSLYFKWIM